jgi:hypothetical protein
VSRKVGWPDYVCLDAFLVPGSGVVTPNRCDRIAHFVYAALWPVCVERIPVLHYFVTLGIEPSLYRFHSGCVHLSVLKPFPSCLSHRHWTELTCESKIVPWRGRRETSLASVNLFFTFCKPPPIADCLAKCTKLRWGETSKKIVSVIKGWHSDRVLI